MFCSHLLSLYHYHTCFSHTRILVIFTQVSFSSASTLSLLHVFLSHLQPLGHCHACFFRTHLFSLCHCHTYIFRAHIIPFVHTSAVAVSFPHMFSFLLTPAFSLSLPHVFLSHTPSLSLHTKGPDGTDEIHRDDPDWVDPLDFSTCFEDV